MKPGLHISGRSNALIACLALAAVATIGPKARAAEWPTQPISLIIPFSPGGSTDIIGRTVGSKLSKELGVSVVPENKGGAAGLIAANHIAKAAPDGYTISLDHIGYAFNQSLQSGPNIPQKNIVPVAFVGSTPNVLVVPNSFPAKTLKEFIEYAKAHPDEIYFGSGGVGSAGHLPMELLQSTAGIKMTHVPYKGSGPAMTDLISGRIQAMLMTIPAVMGAIKTNQVRAIATTGEVRPAALPDIPTFKEGGVDNFVYQPWYGIFAPKDTPKPVLGKLHAAVNKVVSDPEISEKLRGEGLETQAKTEAQFAAEVQADTKKWGAIITRLGLNNQQ